MNNHRLYYFAIDGSQYEDCAYAGVSINSRVLLHGQLGNYTGEPIRSRRSDPTDHLQPRQEVSELCNTITQ
jgi:hypothetical protein